MLWKRKKIKQDKKVRSAGLVASDSIKYGRVDFNCEDDV